MAIVTTHYRYKRPPRKRKAVGDVPAIVTSVDPDRARQRRPIQRGPMGAGSAVVD
jgi:hypothetical protein